MISSPGSPRAESRITLITVALCYLIALFEGFDLQAAGVSAPKLGPAFHMTPAQLGWFFSSSTFGLMLGAALGGRLSDRFGRKAVLTAAVSVFGLMSLVTGLAPDVDALLLARFLTGLGIGGALPNLVALVSENTPANRKNTAVGLLYAGLPSGGALASLVAALVKSNNWQNVFFVGGIAPLVAVPLLLWVLPESRQLQAARMTQTVDGPVRRGFFHALFGEGQASRTLLLWFSFFLALLTMYLLLNWLPTLLVGRGMSREDASLVQLSFNVLGALGSISAGFLMDRVPLRFVVIGAFLSAAACLLLLADVTPVLTAAVAVGGLVGITMSATQALMYALAPRLYPTRVRGTGVGSAVAVGRLGSAVGPLLAAAFLTAGRTPREVLQMLAPVMLVAGVTVLILVTLMERRPPQAG
jgi:MFS transporter, AAHS family, 3-hydroxyphenylpropionic acid transporter